MSWWERIGKRKTQDLTFGILNENQVPDKLKPKKIQSDSEYIDIFLRSMRVVDIRRGLKKFYGTVHCFIQIPHLLNQKDFQQGVSHRNYASGNCHHCLVSV